MNIQDPSSINSGIDSVSQTQPDDSTKTDDKKDKPSKSFSKMLADKAAKERKGASSQQPDPAQAGAPQSFRETAPVVQQTRQTAPAAALPPAMQNLVQEIAVAKGPNNSTQVDIQLNSKTFDGLKVSLSQKGGSVSIQMLSRTPEVAALLNRHVDQLSEALAARGVPVATIQVQTTASTRSSGRGTDSRSDARGQGARGGRQT
jgi:flagellar hook-length control protein FliK